MPVGSLDEPDGGGFVGGGGLDGGGGVTASVIVIAAPALLPSEEAVIVAAPVLTVLTRPVASTRAFVMFELDHVTARPVRMLLFASRNVAEIRTVVPAAKLVDAGETDTEATGTTGAFDEVTVTVALALFHP
jgi:hypothetical protein